MTFAEHPCRTWGLRATAMLASALLAGCIVVPRTTTAYDDECQIVTRHVELEAGQAGRLNDCRDTSVCVGYLAGMGVVTAASFVVSGSIALAGNIMYWLEKQGQCVKPG